MNDIINKVKEEVLKDILKFKEESDDNYDYWEEHIKFVYEESIKLAKLYNADINIVKLGALLHDIALIKKVGDHINGAKIGKEILDKYNIDEDIKNKVIGCIYNHRSSKNATNIEEMCVSAADILAHFDNISLLFYRAFKGYNYNIK